MNIKKAITDIHHSFLSIEASKKRDLIIVGVSLFLLLFSYPLVRATTTSLFLNFHGAKASPYAWVFSVICLSVFVTAYNHLQKRMTIQRIFTLTSLLTAALLVLFYYLLKVSNLWAYPLYVWKEVYIVLMVHTVIGYLNANIPEQTARLIYGPLGAFGSVGGILGALLTSQMTRVWESHYSLFLGAFLIVLTAVIFKKTTIKKFDKKEELKTSPLNSISGVKSYVALICLVVLLSQFIVNIGNYHFNTFLTEAFTDTESKTEFLGNVYASINFLSLLVQILFIPLILKLIPLGFTHLAIPLVYLVFYSGASFLGLGLVGISVTFVVFKGLDYSIFSASKELLYYSLTDIQKYGAKYLVDMIVYRMAKGMISIILIIIPFGFIKPLFFVCIALWLMSLIPLLKKYNSLKRRIIDESITV